MPFEYLESAEFTDQGRKRKNNEDSLIRLPAFGVFCVADGMGGAAEGDVASAALVEHLEQAFEKGATPDMRMGQKLALLQATVNKASTWIKQRAEDRGNKGTGTTCVLIAFSAEQPSRAVACHAGDSRLYRFRGGKLEQVTRDHSVANMAGVTDEKALPAMFRNVITRAVGLQDTAELEQTPTDVREGDLYLICSDGLSRMVNDRLIAKVIEKHLGGELMPLARALIEEANKAGGDDNITVVLVRVGKLPPASADDAEPPTPVVPAPAPRPAPVQEDRDTAERGDRETPTDDRAGSARAATPSTPPPRAERTARPVTPTPAAAAAAAAITPPASAKSLPWGMIGGGIAVALMIGILALVWKLRGDGVVGTHAPVTATPSSTPPVAVASTQEVTKIASPKPTTTTRPVTTSTSSTTTSSTTSSTSAPRIAVTSSTSSSSTTTSALRTTTSSTTSTSTSARRTTTSTTSTTTSARPTTSTSTTSTTTTAPRTTTSSTSTTTSTTSSTSTTALQVDPAVKQVQDFVREGRRDAARLQSLMPVLPELAEFTRSGDTTLPGLIESELRLWTAGLDRMDAWLSEQPPTGSAGPDTQAQATDLIRRVGAYRTAAIQRLVEAEAGIPRAVGDVWSNFPDDEVSPVLDDLAAAAGQATVLLESKDAGRQAELRRITFDVLEQVHAVLPKLKAKMGR
ncbi:MAG: protein phosphatase 2C domain-containing protein [Lentisphaerae bacterium]|nr:protein phosphatase 2C domain-containing protein [Lentisphaerota bacterium]